MTNTSAPTSAHRDTIFVEQSKILDHQAFDGQQHIMRIRAPETAAHALPGSFVHIQCHDLRPMRRPLSIMRVDAKQGWVDLLYRVFGEGTTLLSQRKVGEVIDLMGPIGKPFSLHKDRSRPLLLGGGVGIPPMIFLSDVIRTQHNDDYAPMVMMGSETPFPFTPRPSQILIPGLPDGVIAAMPLLEDWGIASRLASLQGYSGCYEGYITDLAAAWLMTLDDEARNQVEIFACGPHPMLDAVAKLAHRFDLPAQVSLEEYMACAVGGCAGCVVEVQTDNGPAMKRVCVDGPVFSAHEVFPQ